MALSTTSSRFALLTDDAPDPYVKKGKPQLPNTSGKPGVTSGGAGSRSAVQKKDKDKGHKYGTNSGLQSGGGKVANPKNQNKSSKSATLDWDAWERRDTELVTAEYQSQLEEAISQSKLEFQKQQLKNQLQQQSVTGLDGSANSKSSKAKKKKKVAVSISQFHEAVAADSNDNQTPFNSSSVDEESLIQRLRLETHLELVKEKQFAEEKALLLQRNAHFINGNVSSGVTAETLTCDDMDDRDLKMIISQLEKDKRTLEEELDVFKGRFKKLLGLLNDSELKEKVHLQRDLEKMVESNQELSKLNQDLNDELKNAYSQLEQERSRSHAALMEVKKMSEQSRRTHG